MAGRLGADKEIEKIARDARKEGWDVTITGGNHIRWRSPDGKSTVISGLTGATPGWVKAKSQLRRAGLKVR
jgi:predicted RNA binding protein YcfA (HicA-like mRNA interferase family)